MNLIKENWTKNDINDFEAYLLSISHPNKIVWEQNIVNTSINCIFIEANKLNLIAKEIFKGNYISYLDLCLHNNHSETIIYSKLISKIKDIDILEKYLNKLSEFCDNWATCDALKIKVNKTNETKIFNLAKKYIKSNKTFSRRIGYKMLFEFINDKFLDEIFSIINSSYNETEYYVNMIIAWLLCECFIKQRDKTLTYLKTNKLNKFVLNKFISKCLDSYRVDVNDKQFLKSLRVK